MTAGRQAERQGRIIGALGAALWLASCAAPPPPAPDIPAFLTAGIRVGPGGACFATDTTPAVIETVTERMIDTPAVLDETGAVITPATYRSETRQEITRERSEISFETPCPPAFTAAFVESLQRALALRGFYDGPVNGVMDVATGRAVQDFQRRNGPDSPILSIAAARELGLVVLTPEQIDQL